MTVAVSAPNEETNIETHQVSCWSLITYKSLNWKSKHKALPLYISHFINEILMVACFLFHLFKNLGNCFNEDEESWGRK